MVAMGTALFPHYRQVVTINLYRISTSGSGLAVRRRNGLGTRRPGVAIKNCFNSVATIDILITSLYMYSYIQSMYSCSQFWLLSKLFGM